MNNFGRRGLLSMELIDHQSDDFFKQLDVLHEKIIGEIDRGDIVTPSDLRNHDVVKAIESLTFKRTGIRVRIQCDSMLAAVIPFYIGKDHVFLEQWQRGNFTMGDQEEKIDKMLDRKGSVDLKKAKVSGIFSEGVVVVYMMYTELVKTFKMNASELSAVFGHELGHAFNTYEFADRLSSTNQILADAAKRIKKDRSSKVQDYVYREISRHNPKTTRENIEKMMSEDRTIAGPAWVRCYMDCISTQMHNGKYDNTTHEQLADNFVVRFGYGTHLVSALNKLGGENSKWLDSPGSNALAMIFLSTIAAMYIGIVVASAGFGGAGLFTFVSGFVMSRIYFTSENNRDYVYDDPKMRYQRIRNTYVDRLRTSTLNKESLTEILDAVDFLDKVMEKTVSSDSIFRAIGNIIFRSSASAKRSIEEQQALEKLVNNDLYIQSAKLSLK